MPRNRIGAAGTRVIMSAFFPNVNLVALKNYAAVTAAMAHPDARPGTSSGLRRGPPLRPQISSCQDVTWGGEKMIEISFDPATLPLGPKSLLAYFPEGRATLTTQALVGMSEAARRAGLVVPKIHRFVDHRMSADIGAEVVIMDKLPGYSLQDIWPRLSENQRLKVCECVAEILLKLYNEHSPMICTELRGTNVYTGPTLPGQVSPTNTQAPILLSPPFNQGPLSFLPPQPAIYRNDDYLSALAGRMHKVFRTDPRANRQGRKTGYPQARRLTDTDVERVLDTWARLGQLTAHHAGGFYVPGALSRNARQKSYEVLNSAAFGIVHTDMQMYRFIVRIDGSGGSPTDLQVSLATGWEHAFHGPLWSCARVPPWLLPRPQPNEPVHWEEQPRYREAIIGHLRARSPESWFIAHVYGTAERRFENLVSQHWIFRDTSEVALVRLKRFWEIQRPDIAFPLPVGLDYRAPGDGEDPLHQLLALDPPSTSSQWSPDG